MKKIKQLLILSAIIISFFLAVLLTAKRGEPLGFVIDTREKENGCECLIEFPALRIKQYRYMYWTPCDTLKLGDTLKLTK